MGTFVLEKMHTRSGSNGATEPVLISPLPATMAALVVVKLCPRPAGSAIFDLHAFSCDTYLCAAH